MTRRVCCSYHKIWNHKKMDKESKLFLTFPLFIEIKNHHRSREKPELIEVAQRTSREKWTRRSVSPRYYYYEFAPVYYIHMNIREYTTTTHLTTCRPACIKTHKSQVRAMRHNREQGAPFCILHTTVLWWSGRCGPLLLFSATLFDARGWAMASI